MSRVAVGVGCLAVSLIAVAACTSGGTAMPAPASSDPPSTSPSSGTTNSGEPRSGGETLPIQHPVDASPYLKHACHLLSDEQVADLGGKPGSGNLSTKQAGIGIPSECTWDAKSGSATFDASLVTRYSTGLSGLESSVRKTKDYQFNRDTEVDGYPALILREKSDKKIGVCRMYTGINDHVSLLVQVSGSTVSDPCEGLKHVAKAAIETMRKGS